MINLLGTPKHNILGKSFVFIMIWQSLLCRSSSLSRLHDHTQSHHTWSDSFGRVITPLQKPLPDYTQQS